MELTLKVVSGKHAGQKLRIPAPKFLIGRGEDCHLRPNSDLVSRHHCILFVGDSGAAVRDLNSRNGTFVNDERIKTDTPLREGDRLKIGHLTFEVRLKATEAADASQSSIANTTLDPAVARAAPAAVERPPAALPIGAAPIAAKKPASTKETVEMSDTPHGEDEDVLEWFKEDRSGAATRDTVRIEASETTTIVAENFKESLQQAGNANVLEDDKAKKKGPSPSEIHRQQSKDTREAATQILRQLFKSR
jgi:pSer/pThr/pTyr-binding forkhead associated (FHA) protein